MNATDNFRNLDLILDVTLPDVLKGLETLPAWRELELPDDATRAVLTALLQGFIAAGQNEMLAMGMLHPIGRMGMLMICGAHSFQKTNAALQQLMNEAGDMGWSKKDIIRLVNVGGQLAAAARDAAPLLVRLQQDMDRSDTEQGAAQA